VDPASYKLDPAGTKDRINRVDPASPKLDPAGTKDRMDRVDPEDRRRYVRALCRIYLTDYLCTGYSLPAACHGLYEELDADYRAYEQVKAR
jgi:hypothetical protein